MTRWGVRVAGPLVLIIVLSGCTRTIGEASGAGALTGAGIGALVGNNPRAGAAYGAGIGLVTGAIAGLIVQNHQDALAQQEANLSRQVGDLRAINASLRARNQRLSKNLAQLDGQIADLKDEIRRGQATLADKRAALGSALQSIEGEKKSLASAQHVLMAEKRKRGIRPGSPIPPDIRDLENSIQNYWRNLNRAEEKVKSYYLG